jgi:hypothetical protein
LIVVAAVVFPVAHENVDIGRVETVVFVVHDAVDDDEDDTEPDEEMVRSDRLVVLFDCDMTKFGGAVAVAVAATAADGGGGCCCGCIREESSIMIDPASPPNDGVFAIGTR